MANDILIIPGSAKIEFSGSVSKNIELQVGSNGDIQFVGTTDGLLLSLSEANNKITLTQATQIQQQLYIGSGSVTADGLIVIDGEGASEGLTFDSGTGAEKKIWNDDSDDSLNITIGDTKNTGFRLDNTGEGYLGGNRILTTADTGASNNLDADTLDSYDSSDFLRKIESATLTGDIQLSGFTHFSNTRVRYSNVDGTNKFVFKTSLDETDKIFGWTRSGINDYELNVFSGGSEQTVWHTGNMGAGSTLDADLLDGQEGTYYLDYTNFTNVPNFDTDFSNKTTDDLTEGVNRLYYTDTRANSAIDARVTKTFVDALNVDADTLDGIDISNIARTDITETFTQDLIIQGNLTVQGTTTTVSSNEVNIGDNIIVLNADETGAPTENAGIEIERGTSTNVLVRWNESSDIWEFTNNGTNYYPLPTSTNDLAEVNNLYYTDARANSAIDTRVTKSFVENLDLDSDTILYDNDLSNLIASNVKAAIDELDLKKADVEKLSSNIILYPTITAADVSGYFKLVNSVDDPAYPAETNVSTGIIGDTDTLISTLIADANLFVGNPGIINITTLGQIRQTSGNRHAVFWFELWKRDGSGTETLIATSGNTPPVSSNTFEQFAENALLNNGVFVSTDRIVIKFYGVKSETGGSDPVYEFKFGGSDPVRTLIPVPISVIPSSLAEDIIVDTSTFNGPLDGSHTNVQAALDRIDDTITKTYIDSLNIDADTLDGLNSTDFLRSNVADSTSQDLEIRGTKYSYWSDSIHPDIDSLLPGSTFGTLIEGYPAGHFVIGIRGNDNNDGFYVIDTNSGGDAAYARNILSVSHGIFEYKGNRVLTVADEGPGNNLDADTLDGVQSSQFLRNDATSTIASEVSLNIGTGEGRVRLVHIASQNRFSMIPYDGGAEEGGQVFQYNADNGYWEFLGRLDVGGALNVDGVVTFASTLSVTGDPSIGNHVGNRDYNDTRYARLGANNTFTGTNTFNGDIILGENDLRIGSWFNNGGATNLNWTISGTGNAEMQLTADGADYTTAELTVGGNRVLTVGDEGSINAGTLDTLDSTQFLRSDAADVKTNGALRFNDNVILSLGTGNDFEIFHNGTNTYMDMNFGDLHIRDNTTTRFTFQDTGHFTATGSVNSDTAHIEEETQTQKVSIDDASNNKKFEVVYNAVSDSLDFNFVG